MTIQVRVTAIYLEWINGLKDKVVRARIQVRVDRLVHGNPGKHRNLKEGISELKFELGPGYRVKGDWRRTDHPAGWRQ